MRQLDFGDDCAALDSIPWPESPLTSHRLVRYRRFRLLTVFIDEDGSNLAVAFDVVKPASPPLELRYQSQPCLSP